MGERKEEMKESPVGSEGSEASQAGLLFPKGHLPELGTYKLRAVSI